MGAVKRWGDSFERECQVIWERAKKLNGDRTSSAGKTALDESQATKAALLTTSVDVPTPSSSVPEVPELLNLQFPLHNSSSFSGLLT